MDCRATTVVAVIVAVAGITASGCNRTSLGGNSEEYAASSRLRGQQTAFPIFTPANVMYRQDWNTVTGSPTEGVLWTHSGYRWTLKPAGSIKDVVAFYEKHAPADMKSVSDDEVEWVAFPFGDGMIEVEIELDDGTFMISESVRLATPRPPPKAP